MSRRASLLAKQEKRKPRVRFPDELVFLDNMKGNDIKACHSMLRRASIQMDINGLDNSGLTPLHNAVLEGNLAAVKLLVQHGADINRRDADTWTPLHAACANGEAEIARYLLYRGANRDAKTDDGERPLDLCDARDFSIISVMLESDTARKARLLSTTDEEMEFEEDENDMYVKRSQNSSTGDDTRGQQSSGSSQEPGASLRGDIKNANSSSKSSTSSFIKGIKNLRTLYEKSSSSTSFSATSTAQKNTSSPNTKGPTSQITNDTPATKPPKPAGKSILKKSPQQFKTVTE